MNHHSNTEPFTEIPPTTELAQPKTRHDGWSPDRQQVFLEALARTGSVKAAAAYTGLSRESAYRLRRRADAKAFLRAWDAALIHARDLYADDLLDRGLSGWTEAVWHLGEEVGTRERWSAPLFLTALARLDRKADGIDKDGNPARIAATHFDELVERIGAGEDCEDLLAEQEASRESAAPYPPMPSTSELLVQMEQNIERQRIGEMRPEDIDISDLDIADRESWDELQWERADRSGLLARSGIFDEEQPSPDEDEKTAPDDDASKKPDEDASKKDV